MSRKLLVALRYGSCTDQIGITRATTTAILEAAELFRAAEAAAAAAAEAKARKEAEDAARAAGAGAAGALGRPGKMRGFSKMFPRCCQYFAHEIPMQSKFLKERR